MTYQSLTRRTERAYTNQLLMILKSRALETPTTTRVKKNLYPGNIHCAPMGVLDNDYNIPTNQEDLLKR